MIAKRGCCKLAQMLAPGTRLGPYEIISPAGAGGMGEVYRARDTRLDRTVAVKVLASNLTARPDVLQRFEREARAVSTLNHPNICTLHDVGTDNGTPYLVMEYVEGETLADRLERGPLPLAEAWRIAIQIGDALDQAHRRGIVHRDLKPGNVMLAGARGSTHIKLLDFGLAKLPEAHSANAAGSLTSLPTVVQSLTTEGTIVGTFQYMAPEQLEGKEADARSDIFAFGAVLYEMIAGRKAFEGQSQASLISAIMKDEPPSITALQPMSPPALDRLIRQCLAKEPDERWQTVRDLTRELRWISQSSSQIALAPAVAATRKRRIGAAAIAASVLAIALAALAAIHFREKAPESRVARFLVDPPGTFRWFDTPAVSPDGTQVAFTSATPKGSSILLRTLDSPVLKPLPGTEEGSFPFWSPDGKNLGFIAQGKLKKLNLASGIVASICEARTSCCGTWSPNDTILFAGESGTRLWRVSAAGGTPAPMPFANSANLSTTRTWPSFLPDGNHFLYSATSARTEDRGVWVGSLDSAPPVRILPDFETNAQYSAPGYLLFDRNDAMFAQAFDATRLRLSGEAFPIAEQVSRLIVIAGAHFSVGGGNLAFRTGQPSPGGQLVWYDRAGNRLGTVGPSADYTNPALSPDGRLLAVCVRDPATRKRDIWVYDLARGTSSRLTFDPADDFNPTWSPDGQSIIFASDRKGARDLYRKLASGTGPDEPLFQSGEDKSPEHWTPDGKFLLFNTGSLKHDVWMLPLSDTRTPVAVLNGQFSSHESQVSPNGKWIAYVSNESGKSEVFVQNFPPAGGKWPISTAGGMEPQWSRDGSELFYIQDSQLMAVFVKDTGGRFEAGLPKALFSASLPVGGRNRYVVSPDGKRFLVSTRAEMTTSSPMMIVLNWTASIKK
uniref:Serine/threonine protein kinase n=1 Tax=Solibacter usitatus (strain Ellin6076) TaxID=234267 RepID=Q01TY9_SOLUE